MVNIIQHHLTLLCNIPIVYNNCCSNYWGRSSDNTCQQCSTCATGYSLITACQTYADAVCRGKNYIYVFDTSSRYI